MTAAHVASSRGVQQGHGDVLGQCLSDRCSQTMSYWVGLQIWPHIMWYMSWYLVDAVDFIATKHVSKLCDRQHVR